MSNYEDVTDCMICPQLATDRDDALAEAASWERIARLVKAQSDRWQEMAEDLWDELMAWHTDDCQFPETPIGTPDDRCTCHRILAAKWAEITNAADWADDEPEAGEL